MATENFFNKKQPWSEVKDKIIAGYLTPYCAKLLATRQPLKIIDCFAGKGKFDDLKDGSPLMIAKVIKNILNQKDTYTNKNIEACFIEQKYHAELKNNLLYYANCKVISGSFENNISEMTAGEVMQSYNELVSIRKANKHHDELFVYLISDIIAAARKAEVISEDAKFISITGANMFGGDDPDNAGELEALISDHEDFENVEGFAFFEDKDTTKIVLFDWLFGDEPPVEFIAFGAK